MKRIKDTRATRLYGPYEAPYEDGLRRHWIAETPDGEKKNFYDPLDLAIWLDKRPFASTLADRCL